MKRGEKNYTKKKIKNIKILKKSKKKKDEGQKIGIAIIGGGFETIVYKRQNKDGLVLKEDDFIEIKLWNNKKKKFFPMYAKIRTLKPHKPPRYYTFYIRKISYDEILEIFSSFIKDKLEPLLKEPELDFKIIDKKFEIKQKVLKIKYIAEKKLNLTNYAKELASTLHIRVEFEQIGRRDYARIVGDIGPCGRPLCCKTFLLGELKSITIDMVKIQNLNLSLSKLTGICNRLFCCMAFEYDFYLEQFSKFPKIGQEIKTVYGPAKVKDIDLFLNQFRAELETGEEIEFYVNEEGQKWWRV